MEFIAFCSFRVKSHKNFFNNLLKNDIAAPLEHNDDSSIFIPFFFCSIVFIHSLLFGFSNVQTEARERRKKNCVEQQNYFTFKTA